MSSNIQVFRERLIEMNGRLKEIRALIDAYYARGGASTAPILAFGPRMTYLEYRLVAKEETSLRSLIRHYEAIIWFHDNPGKYTQLIEKVGYTKECRDLYQYYYSADYALMENL
jgi:hypothetical protein